MKYRILLTLLGVGAIGCATPTEPQPIVEKVWVPTLDAQGRRLYEYDWGGAPFIVTEDQLKNYNSLFITPRGTWVPKDSRISNTGNVDPDPDTSIRGDGTTAIRDPFRDTTCY